MLARTLLVAVVCAALAAFPLAAVPKGRSIEDTQFDLGMNLYRLGRYGEAIVEFRRLLDAIGTTAYADASCFYLACSSFSSGDFPEAKRFFGLVVERYRESAYAPPSLYFLARIAFIEKRYEESIPLFTAYEKGYPSLAYADNALYWKGEAFLMLGENGKARESLNALIERYPGGDRADAARCKLRVMDLQGETSSSAGRPCAPGGEGDPSGAPKADEREREIEEKLKALGTREKLLDMKEQALNEKEKKLRNADQSLPEAPDEGE